MSDKTKRVTLELRESDDRAETCSRCHLTIANADSCPCTYANHPMHCGDLGYWMLLPEAPQ